VPHRRAVVAARTLDRTVARGEDHDLALLGGDRLALGLGARPLLDQEEVAALVVDPAPTEEAGELQREDDLAVEVLVQAVVATRLVVEQQGRRLRLALLPAPREQRAERGRMEHGRVERHLPLIGDGGQGRIRVHAERVDQRRQRRREVLVLADAEAVARHVDAAAEARVLAVE
jgi:hypothetical protein